MIGAFTSALDAFLQEHRRCGLVPTFHCFPDTVDPSGQKGDGR